MSLLVASAVVAAGALYLVGWVAGVASSAPNISELKPRDPGQLSEVFAADGTRLGYIRADILRTPVAQHSLPRVLTRATVAIEDRRFWQHGGVDLQGILRAGVQDVFGDTRNIQGGSTLTMQLVRNMYLSHRLADTRSLKRKIIEAKLAEELEHKRTKRWILTQYLNDVDYGTVGGLTAVGAGAASQLFFDKPVWRLDVGQAALLAGLPQAPSQFNPFLDPRFARVRRHQVLQAMVQSDYISRAQARRADHSSLQVRRNDTYTRVVEPYVFDYVRQALIQRFGLATVEKGGLKVYTTIDLHRQEQARQAILANEGRPGDPAAALVSIDPSDGHIMAMATSSSYNQTNFDYATQAHRQTGSAFKVFVLMTLIHDYDGDPNQTYYDSHELMPGWLPGYPTYHVQTAEHSYLGNISVTKATTLSDNTVYAQLDADVGPDRVRDMAYAMGITSHLDGTPAEGIGGLRIGVSPLQMADAYATIAGGGSHVAPTAIAKVVFPDGSSINLGDPRRRRVFSPGEAYAATQVLKTVIQSGTGTAANYGCPAAGKTGTNTDYTDAWFVGYTPRLSTAVWVGYPHANVPMFDVNGLGPGFGGTLAAPIWHDYMEHASGGYCGDFTAPAVGFHGTPFYGTYATTASSSSLPVSSSGAASGSGSPSSSGPTSGSPSGSSSGSPAGSGSGSRSAGGGGGTGTNPYNNPSLYAQPPQPPPPTTGTTGKPPGLGRGHPRSSGGGRTN
jgi:penicillin-binding protein 1A